jgi:hypothetical protein
MKMAVTEVGNQLAAAAETPLTPEEEAALEAKFEQVLISVAMPMILRQMNFMKQTVSEKFNENQE